MPGTRKTALPWGRATAVRVAAVALWLVVWQVGSVALAQPLILPGPLEVLSALAGLVRAPGFWSKVGFSLARIVGGCALAYAVAGLLAWASAASRAVRVALRPPLVAIKSTPVACVVVLLLIWLGAENVSLAAVFLMALPGVYFALVEGLDRVDGRLAELLRVSGVRGLRRWLALTWPGVLPFLVAASEVVVGMSWKAGVAAELIGTPMGSIGERIYQTKLLLDTAGLFAWTIVVIALATVCEHGFLALLRASGRASVRLAVRLRPRGGERRTEVSGVHARGIVLAHGAAGGQPLFLDVPAGGRLCVMGPSGEGKTTLLRTLCGLDVPVAGQVELPGADGRPVRLAVDFQDSRLVEAASAFENVALTADASCPDGSIRALLADAIPGLDADVPVSELSGGQRRRVELVRALVAPGSAVLLDEPFSGLDARSHEHACTLVRRELHGRTLVVATHDERDAGLLGAEVLRIEDCDLSELI